MFCNQCGQALSSSDRFCPRCGAIVPAVPEQPAAETAEAENLSSSAYSKGQAYTRQDYNPQNPSQHEPASAPKGDRPGVTVSIVLAIINIVLVGFGISLILGVVALAYTILATHDTDMRKFRTKMSAAKALNLTGLVLIAAQFVVIFGVIIAVFG